MSEPEWVWKIAYIEGLGTVTAQIKEVTGPDRHFLVRRVRPFGINEGKMRCHPKFNPILEDGEGGGFTRGDITVYPHALHWTSGTAPGNVEVLDRLYQTVQAATPAEVNRLKYVEGRNGGK